MTPAELRVAVDEGLPVTFVVWNNAAFREIAEAMQSAQTRVIGCSPSPFDMAPLAAACGLPFAPASHRSMTLSAALKAPAKGPRLIEVQAR